MSEHSQRLREFTQRFNIDNDSSQPTIFPPRHFRNKSIIFPHLLVREETMPALPVPRLQELARPATKIVVKRREDGKHLPVSDRPQELPSCAEVEAQYLSRVLPFSGIVDLQQQLRFVSIDHKESIKCQPDEDLEDSKLAALLSGLRRLPPQDVRLLPSVLALRILEDVTTALPPSSHRNTPLLSTQETTKQLNNEPEASKLTRSIKAVPLGLVASDVEQHVRFGRHRIFCCRGTGVAVVEVKPALVHGVLGDCSVVSAAESSHVLGDSVEIVNGLLRLVPWSWSDHKLRQIQTFDGEIYQRRYLVACVERVLHVPEALQVEDQHLGEREQVELLERAHVVLHLGQYQVSASPSCSRSVNLAKQSNSMRRSGLDEISRLFIDSWNVPIAIPLQCKAELSFRVARDVHRLVIARKIADKRDSTFGFRHMKAVRQLLVFRTPKLRLRVLLRLLCGHKTMHHSPDLLVDLCFCPFPVDRHQKRSVKQFHFYSSLLRPIAFLH
ncbi:hypothetical protein GQ600_16819 [Phytophthora cactorum]|nr:hypothetical protein GQ600_16819 [Phytophthora cactorum]